MHYDFSSVQDRIDLRCVPPGTFACTVREVREGTARDGSVRWSLRLEVADGPHAGHHATWDSITWSERGVHRARHILAALGFDVSGRVDLEAGELTGRSARIDLVEESWQDPVTKSRKEFLTIPYAGWHPLEEGSNEADAGQRDSSRGAADDGLDPF